jgi:hypothetical protein
VRAQPPDNRQHFSAEDFVPLKIAFDVDAVGAARQGFPNRITRFHARRFHFIAFGDDAGPMVPQHADPQALQMRKSHSLGGDVKAIRVDVANGVHAP